MKFPHIVTMCTALLRLAAASPVDSDSEYQPAIPLIAIHDAAATPNDSLPPPRPFFWELHKDQPIVEHLDFDTDLVDTARPSIQNGSVDEDHLQTQPSHDLVLRADKKDKKHKKSKKTATPADAEVAAPADAEVAAPADGEVAVVPDNASEITDISSPNDTRPPFTPTCTRRKTMLWTRREWELRWDGDHDPNGFNHCGERVLWGLMQKLFCLPIKDTWECKRLKNGHGGEGQVVVAFVTGAACSHAAVERALRKGSGGRVDIKCTKW